MAVHRDVGRLEQALHHRQSQASGWAKCRPSRRRAASRHPRRPRPRRPAGRSRRPGSRARSAVGTVSPWRCHLKATSVVLLQRGGEHRVGAVPVRPQLHVRARPEFLHRAEQRPGVQRGHRLAAQRIVTTPTVSARCGEQVAPQHDPPGRSARSPRRAVRAAVWPTGARRRGAATRLRPPAQRPRARCGASTSTGRIRRAAAGDSQPSTRSTSTGSPRVLCSTNSARRSGGLDGGHREAVLGGDADQGGLAPGRRTDPASARRRRRPGGRVRARATSWLPSSCTSA